MGLKYIKNNVWWVAGVVVIGTSLYLYSNAKKLFESRAARLLFAAG